MKKIALLIISMLFITNTATANPETFQDTEIITEVDVNTLTEETSESEDTQETLEIEISEDSAEENQDKPSDINTETAEIPSDDATDNNTEDDKTVVEENSDVYRTTAPTDTFPYLTVGELFDTENAEYINFWSVHIENFVDTFRINREKYRNMINNMFFFEKKRDSLFGVPCPALEREAVVSKEDIIYMITVPGTDNMIATSDEYIIVYDSQYTYVMPFNHSENSDAKSFLKESFKNLETQIYYQLERLYAPEEESVWTYKTHAKVLFEAELSVQLDDSYKGTEIYKTADASGKAKMHMVMKQSGAEIEVKIGNRTYWGRNSRENGEIILYLDLALVSDTHKVQAPETYEIIYEFTPENHIKNVYFELKRTDNEEVRYTPTQRLPVTIVSQTGDVSYKYPYIYGMGRTPFTVVTYETHKDTPMEEQEEYVRPIVRNEDGVLYDCHIDFAARQNAKVTVTSQLEEITSDGNIEITVINLVRTTNGRARRSDFMVRLKGDKGYKWYEIKSSFTSETYFGLVRMTFYQMESFENYVRVRRPDNKNTIGVEFQYDTETLGSFTAVLSVDGRKFNLDEFEFVGECEKTYFERCWGRTMYEPFYEEWKAGKE